MFRFNYPSFLLAAVLFARGTQASGQIAPPPGEPFDEEELARFVWNAPPACWRRAAR